MTFVRMTLAALAIFFVAACDGGAPTLGTETPDAGTTPVADATVTDDTSTSDANGTVDTNINTFSDGKQVDVEKPQSCISEEQYEVLIQHVWYCPTSFPGIFEFDLTDDCEMTWNGEFAGDRESYTVHTEPPEVTIQVDKDFPCYPVDDE